MKNIVLGLAVDYNASDIQSFVKSFRKFNQQDDVLLFVNRNRSDFFIDFLKSYNIKFSTFESFQYSDTRMNNVRFIKYIEFLTDNLNYKNVLITDTRDLIFQGDPFNALSDDVHLFKEDPGIKLGECIYNKFWTESAYDSTILEILKDKTILCAGTILGSSNKVLNLLLKIKDELDLLRQKNYNNYRTVNVDQAILNKIVYVDEYCVNLHTNGDIVGTIGQSVTQARAQDIVTTSEGNILVNGFSPAIIHQYDRHEILKDFIFNLYK